MGSPVTFSGFNSIDFNLILNAVMEQARVPVQTLQTRLSGVESRISSFGTLNSHAFALQQSAGTLGDPTSIDTLSSTSSDPAAVGVSVSSAASAGTFDVVINQLARAQVTVSSSVAPDANTTIVADGGTITIGGVDVTIASGVTLQELANTVNGTANIGVTATVVQTGTNSFQLAFASTDTGLANAFTLTNALTLGPGGGPGGPPGGGPPGGGPASSVTFVDTDGDGVSGDSAADNVVSAADASLLINNIAVSSSSNTFTDVVTGVTLTAFREDPGTTVRIDVASDSTALKSKVQGLIDAYNTLVEFHDAERASSSTGDTAAIGNDPLVRQLRSSLRSLLLGAHGTGNLTRLAEVGLEFTRTGTLTLNDAVFDQAITTQANDVRDLFAGTSGVFAAVEAELAGYTNVDGLIPLTTDRLDDQVDSMGSQIDAMEARLEVQRQALQRQFIEADLAMSRLNGQAGSLASFGSGLGSL